MTIAGKMFDFEDPRLNTELTRIYDLMQNRVDRSNIDAPDVARSIAGVFPFDDVEDAIPHKALDLNDVRKKVPDTSRLLSFPVNQPAPFTLSVGLTPQVTGLSLDNILLRFPVLFWSRDGAGESPQALPSGSTQTVVDGTLIADLGTDILLCMSGDGSTTDQIQVDVTVTVPATRKFFILFPFGLFRETGSFTWT